MISLLPIPRKGSVPACSLISKSWLYIGLSQHESHQAQLFKWLATHPSMRLQAGVMAQRRMWVDCLVFNNKSAYILLIMCKALQTHCSRGIGPSSRIIGHLPSPALHLCSTFPSLSRKHYFWRRKWDVQCQWSSIMVLNVSDGMTPMRDELEVHLLG